MTSWITTSLKKKVTQEPVSYFPYKEGKFTIKSTEATVVSAFYDIPSSLSLQKRKEKLKQFVEQFPCKLVLFTEQKFANELASYREDLQTITRVIVLERADWVANTKFIPALWSQQVKQDVDLRTSRTAEEFQFGYEKKEFMIKAVQMNPFKSEDFVWVSPSFIESLSYPVALDMPDLFPIPAVIPTDRILVANPEPFKADDIASSYFKGKNRISNDIVAGSKKAWEEYSKTYDVVMTQRLKVFAFVGDELMNLHYVIIHKPNQFSLVPEPSLLNYLSVPKDI